MRCIIINASTLDRCALEEGHSERHLFVENCRARYVAPSGSGFFCLLPEGHEGQHEHIVDGSGVKWDQNGPLDSVDHPTHYGGADNPYEAIKVIEAWQLGFCLGNCVKYICRAGKKNKPTYNHTREDSPLTPCPLCVDKTLGDLKKARWYLNREIERLEKHGFTTEA